MSAWIRMIKDREASESLTEKLHRVRAPDGSVSNVMRVHSLRPETMIGHHALYMSVLHHDDNALPGWLLETIATYTSLLNRCDYSFTNHWSNARHLINDDARADEILAALQADAPERVFEGRDLALLRYTRKLTVVPGDIVRADIEAMRAAGAGDGDILEANQVCCYFNYANRSLNGLGVTLAGDVVGYYAEEGRSTGSGATFANRTRAE